MSIESEADEILNKIDMAVREALNTSLRRGLLEEIQSQALFKVYSYGATPEAEMTRRYTIGDERVMEIESGGGGGEYYLKITNRAVTQHPASDDESDIVEEGYASYRQPGPRKFMTPAIENYIGSGRAQADLDSVLSSYGLL